MWLLIRFIRSKSFCFFSCRDTYQVVHNSDRRLLDFVLFCQRLVRHTPCVAYSPPRTSKYDQRSRGEQDRRRSKTEAFSSPGVPPRATRRRQFAHVRLSKSSVHFSSSNISGFSCYSNGSATGVALRRVPLLPMGFSFCFGGERLFFGNEG